MRIRPVLAWYDLWIGAYWDRERRRLYLLPLPCLGVVLDFGRPCAVRDSADAVCDDYWTYCSVVALEEARHRRGMAGAVLRPSLGGVGMAPGDRAVREGEDEVEQARRGA